MAKSKRRNPQPMLATVAVFRGNATTSMSLPIQLHLTRPLTMSELKLLWDAERALNALPLHSGDRVMIDISATEVK